MEKLRTIVVKVFVVAGAALANSSLAWAQIAVATEPTQMMNGAKLSALIRQLAVISQKTELLRQDLDRSVASGAVDWTSTKNLLDSLNQAAAAQDSVSYALTNVDDRFKNQFRGYDVKENAQKEYKAINNAALNSMRGALNAAQLQTQQFGPESQALGKLVGKSNNAAGQTQALQAGNAILAQLVYQTQLVRQLLASQLQAQVAFMAAEVSKEATREVEVKKLTADVFSAVPMNGVYDDYPWEYKSR
ncbi:MAG: hypothetical protein HQL23_05910 [Candidatus Omnitrophica bacterium]|nr:hypothetical protein [Candidatus Omnitrophota bacterium]